MSIRKYHKFEGRYHPPGGADNGPDADAVLLEELKELFVVKSVDIHIAHQQASLLFHSAVHRRLVPLLLKQRETDINYRVQCEGFTALWTSVGDPDPEPDPHVFGPI
jgi:hypothetical protein